MFRKTWEALAGAVVFAGSLVGATSAQAADLGGASGYGSMKDAGPAMTRPHIGTWSGIYLGVNAGVSWENYSSDYKRFSPADPEAPRYSSSETSGLLGGHVGIQHQLGRIVVGVEGSWSGNGPFSNDFHGQKCFPTGGGPDYHCEARMNSFFTVGPRLGVTHNNMMFYLTGGYASGQIQSREYDPQNLAVTVPAQGIEKWKWAARHDGWFVGGGAEMMLRDRWVLGLEYLHIDLDTATHYKPISPSLTRAIDGEADIVRLRLSYKFGRGDGGHTDQPLK